MRLFRKDYKAFPKSASKVLILADEHAVSLAVVNTGIFGEFAETDLTVQSARRIAEALYMAAAWKEKESGQ